MKKFLTLSLLLLAATLSYGQTSVKGKLVDAENGEPLIGATILVLGTSTGTITDFEGNFILKKPEGKNILEFSYTGYTSIRREVTASGEVELGTIELETAVIGLNEVEVIASVAIDRKTPVAVSTISGEKIEALVGNQEYPEILRNTPSVYVTKQGGGFGDSRINVRGFDQRNTAVMINGIPVNDMENGWVYWSNWAGLSDVTSNLQVQRGLGASKLAVASVGGSINIITNAAEMEKGGTVNFSIGNDGYQKYGLALSTGLGKNGWALTVQGTHTRGDGYVDGTMFRAYSYFASLSKSFDDGDQMLSITALGAPQWHHQRLVPGFFDRYNGLPVNLRTYHDPDNTGEVGRDMGIRFNYYWGFKDGEEYNWRRNFYHKPKAFINHYWTISSKTDLKTSAYISLGRGGGTGPRGAFVSGTQYKFSADEYDEKGAYRFDDIVSWNQGNSVPDFGDDKQTWNEFNGDDAIDNRLGTFGDRYVSTPRYGYLRRASMNAHNWYGVLSTLTHKFNSNWNLVAGVDARYYKGIHYRRVDDLLGSGAYFEDDNINNAGVFVTQEKESKALADLMNDIQIDYYNDGLVNWVGLFGQLEYTNGQLTAFASLSGSNQGFKRIDYFNYLDGDDTEADGNPKQETDWENFLGGTAKAGFNYNINEQHNVYVNGGYFSRQPIFDNVFINFLNTVNDDIENQKVYAVELGYGFRSSVVKANLNLYNTVWTDRQFDRSVMLDSGEEGNALFRGVGQIHRGIEFEATVYPVRGLDINGMASFGSWEYQDNFVADVFNTDTQQKLGTATIFADGLKVGDAAQTTMSLGAGYEIVRGLRVYGNYYFADNLYAAYDINDSQIFQPGGDILQLPSYSLVDAGAAYNFRLGGIGATLRFNINNLFDEIYISESATNILDDPSTPNVNELYDNRGFFGFGRTWNTSLRLRF